MRHYLSRYKNWWKKRMKFQVTVARDEDGVWIIECPAIPGCITQGNSKVEAIKNIQEAITLCLEVRAEQGLPLTIRQLEVAI
jgi:predicted RNase H-like HicB family nuclease